MVRSASLHNQPRRGGITVIVALTLIPLFALVAFSVDLAYIRRTDAELQNAADAAALAAELELMAISPATAQSPVDPLSLNQRTQMVQARALASAKTIVALHRAGDVNLVLNDTDVQFGYISDPGASPDTAAGMFQTGSPAQPNSVQVTVRRDANVSTGALPLFFGPVLGVQTSNRSGTATATVADRSVTGFNGAGGKLLPLAIDLATLNYLRLGGIAPSGVLAQDKYTVTLPQAGGRPPSNVTACPDGIPEASIFPDSTAPGNFGLVSLQNGTASNTSTYDNWIRNGPSAADLASFGLNGLQATATTPATMYGGPGSKGGLDGAFKSIIGQPRVLIVFKSFSGSGSNTTHSVVGFVGATVVAADLTATPPYVTIQLMPVFDPTATVGSPGSGSSTLIFRAATLSR